MIETFPVALPRLTGKRERKAYVYVPDAALSDEGARYPVLYMFDGHNVFFDADATYGKSWGMLEYLDGARVPLIVAAVECNHSPKNGRLSEYAPFTFQDPSFGRVYGRGELTMDWMIRQFKPYVDANYPTLPGREATFIAGSSMGGLMSLYALLRHNEVYSRAAALSPSLWTGLPRVLRMIREAQVQPGTVLYMDYGEAEMARREGMARGFGQACAQLMERGVLLTSRIVPGGEHCESSWEKQIPFFLHTLLYE